MNSNLRPVGFFVHHQGRGHAKRCRAIIREMSRPVTVFTADPSLFEDFPHPVIELPDPIGAPVPTPGLMDVPTPETLHCVPLGLPELRRGMRLITEWFDEVDPALFVVDVSAEYAILSRICSVPAVKIRMHGDRSDPGHVAAYEACVGMLAPFAPCLEQPDYPAWAREKTFYTGGLVGETEVVERHAAREHLGIGADEHVIVAVAGGGGSGTPYAPLTVGARAYPDSRWIVLGPVHREGHETDFGNLHLAGWVDRPSLYLAAADVVLGSAGDNLVHEVAQVGRPFLCVPEWRYFDEQTVKGECLARNRLAHVLPSWPGTLSAWREAVAAAEATSVADQRSLVDPAAARKAADWLEGLIHSLWSPERVEEERPGVLKLAAENPAGLKSREIAVEEAEPVTV